MKIRRKVEEHIEKHVQFYIVYKVNPTKQNNEGEEKHKKHIFKVQIGEYFTWKSLMKYMMRQRTK